MTKTKFDKVMPNMDEKMRQIEDNVGAIAIVPTAEAQPVETTAQEQEPVLKQLPEELVSGDVSSHLAFTVRIEKDLKERLAFLVLLLKRSGDKNISVASTVERILRNNVNSELKELGYNVDGDSQ